MNKRKSVVYFALLIVLLLTQTAFAYVGPGAGLTLLGSLIGVLIAIFSVLAGILIWPVRRWLKRKKLDNIDPDKSTREELR